MKSNEGLPKRKIARLQTYDYSRPGGYFITICTHGKACLFGEITEGRMVLNEWGKVVERAWLNLSQHYAFVQLDSFVVMPDHFHAILFIGDSKPMGEADMASHVPTRRFGSPIAASLSSIVASFKSGVTREIRHSNHSKIRVWQTRFIERILRDGEDLDNHRIYIRNNPANWSAKK